MLSEQNLMIHLLTIGPTVQMDSRHYTDWNGGILILPSEEKEVNDIQGVHSNTIKEAPSGKAKIKYSLCITNSNS